MTNGLNSAGTAFLTSLKQSLHKHPKRVSAAVAAVLLTGGGGAFAVASLGPDAADLPMVTLTESVPSLATDLELADLSELNALALYRSDVTRSNDNPEAMLQRLGIADPAASAFLRADALSQQNLLGRTGRVLSAEADSEHRLGRLTARWAPDDSGNFKRLVIERQADGSFSSQLQTAELAIGNRLGSGVITSSLFAATDAAGIPDAVAVQLAEIFSGNIDFRRALRKGDHFSVVYETLEADGEPMRTGRVLSAEFHNNGKTFNAVWFQDKPEAKGAYYTLDGNSMNRAYLTSPVAYTRVSSGFKMRFHPIQKTWRAHLGTDLAAPSGTPVRTIGDGTVSFAGVQNGYGNVVYVKHANQHETVYAHLSRIDVRKGQAISQGQTIGAVGQTGWATGPHLHFEFRVNGKQQDPMAMALRSEAAAPIAAAQRSAFERLAGQMRVQLDYAQQTLQTAQVD
ncbi:M23 family metallopeptidase [Comamonas flocculans]|uniref:M23 family metallopeptidase n=1 Tax=Comamonas flocculans TaxID=2597701 RepID=A0A5B8RUY0_9BURK|nr:M23 family metallopeptidase [Comamonas flocculans]QEA13419.1 M23 family metallopeptidase [Comamonas flocculans]